VSGHNDRGKTDSAALCFGAGVLFARHGLFWDVNARPCRKLFKLEVIPQTEGNLVSQNINSQIFSSRNICTSAITESSQHHHHLINVTPLGSTTKNFCVPTLPGLRRSLSTYALGIVNWYFYQNPDNPTSARIKSPSPSNDKSTKQHHIRPHHGSHVETHFM
jgi:hypothetical protein